MSVAEVADILRRQLHRRVQLGTMRQRSAFSGIDLSYAKERLIIRDEPLPLTFFEEIESWRGR